MSKLTFRARALDCIKRLPLYRKDELPDLAEYAANQRSVPAMPSGMEKEEEMELHLQQVISARQSVSKPIQPFDVYIPIPRVETERNRYEGLYNSDFVQPKRFITTQNATPNLMDYDMDSEDEVWLETVGEKLNIERKAFEDIMGSLETRSQLEIITLDEARAFFNLSTNVVDELYNYWLNKRKSGRSLIPQVLTDNRDFSLIAYIAFRRRVEKMATRKHRKSEQDTVVRASVTKKSIHIAGVDVTGSVVERDNMRAGFIMDAIEAICASFCTRDWKTGTSGLLKRCKSSPAVVTKKNEVSHRRRLKKPMLCKGEMRKSPVAQKTLPVTGRKTQGALRPAENNQADQMDIHNPDGRFTFRRKRNCVYYLPASSPSSGISASSREAFYPVHLRSQLLYGDDSLRFAGFCRRRRARGGRVVFDRLLEVNENWSKSANNSVPVNERNIVYKPQSALSNSKNDLEICDLNFLVDSNRDRLDVAKYNEPEKNWHFSVRFGIHLPPECEDSPSVIGLRINAIHRKRQGNSHFSEPQPKKMLFDLMLSDAEWPNVAVQTAEQPPKPTACLSSDGTLAHVYPDAKSCQPGSSLRASPLPQMQGSSSPVAETSPDCTSPLKKQALEDNCHIAVDRGRKPPNYYKNVEKCHCPPESCSSSLPSTAGTSINSVGTYRNAAVPSTQNVTNFKNAVSVDHGNYVSFSPVDGRDVHPVLTNGATSSNIMSQQNGNGSFSNTGSVDADSVVCKPSQTECLSTSVTPYRIDCSSFRCVVGYAWNTLVHKTGTRFKLF
uniref:Enhancer of polycomb-like protein n=1 Tax=Trichuris muris TaxID=70415 RepID=A0A5S6QJC2_TRIMR